MADMGMAQNAFCTTKGFKQRKCNIGFSGCIRNTEKELFIASNLGPPSPAQESRMMMFAQHSKSLN